jgi:hypothetical protein
MKNIYHFYALVNSLREGFVDNMELNFLQEYQNSWQESVSVSKS